jgi:hypothetical protein
MVMKLEKVSAEAYLVNIFTLVIYSWSQRLAILYLNLVWRRLGMEFIVLR